MSWIGRLLRRAPELDSAQRAALEAYRSRAKPDLRTPLGLQRMAVVDVETSGLDPFNDRLISIGAITVRGGLARVDESFEVVLRQALPSPDENIVVHGIGGSAQLAGREPGTALLDFLSFTDKAPVVAFNADFDCIVIERAVSSSLNPLELIVQTRILRS
jgi:DNA polymerase-3 subunit epsilon